MPRGTAAGIGASFIFAGLYFITPMLAPLNAEGVWATRTLITVPFIAVLLTVMRQMRLFTEIGRRIRRHPMIAVGILASGLLLSLQLWLFGWGPLNGRGLEVALGYFLMPLVLVIIGRFLYKDELKWWHWVAAGVASIGVGFQVANVGAVSWETLTVALGYPLYFVLRRSLRTANTGGMLWEFLAVSPIGIWLLADELMHGTAFSSDPNLWWFASLFALVAALALWLYILASRLLPISIFGLLSYLEPALLVVAAMLIGERIAREEYVTYGAIWIAVLILLVGGVTELMRGRRRRL